MTINKIILVVLVLFSFTTKAQDKDKHEKIKALKIAYLTEQLNLTTKEAENFWPIYNAFEDKKDKIRQQKRSEIFKKLKNIDELTESEASKLLELDISLNKKTHELEEKLIYDVRKVISAKKTFILLQAENGFKRKLLKQYRQKNKSGDK